LERCLGKINWIGPRRKQLPVTIALLTTLIESTKEFRRRRIAWAANELRNNDDVSVWEIIRLAGVSRLTKQEVEAVLVELSACEP
jgi:hypothetical protein